VAINRINSPHIRKLYIKYGANFILSATPPAIIETALVANTIWNNQNIIV